MWRADGKELFFFAPDSTTMATSVDTTKQFESAVPRVLFTSPALVSGSGRSFASASGRSFAVSKDGTRFLVNLPRQQAAASSMSWHASPAVLRQSASRVFCESRTMTGVPPFASNISMPVNLARICSLTRMSSCGR